MGIFGDVKKAKPSEGGRYFPEGLHAVVLTRVTNKEDGYKGKSFIVAGSIIESDNEEAATGVEHSWVQNRSKEGADGRIKTFLMKALDLSEKELDAEINEDEDAFEDSICGEEQALVGLILMAEGYPAQTKKKENITAVKWHVAKETELARLFKKAKEMKLCTEPCKLQAELIKKAAKAA